MATESEHSDYDSSDIETDIEASTQSASQLDEVETEASDKNSWRFSNISLNFFKHCFSSVYRFIRRNTPLLKKQAMPKDANELRQYQRLTRRNAKVEPIINVWLASVTTLVGPQVGFVDQFIPPGGRTNPVAAFTTGAHSVLTLSMNSFFSSQGGDHTRGVAWSKRMAFVTLLLSILLFLNSMAITGLYVDDEEDLESPIMIYLMVLQYCLQATIPFPQFANLGYHLYDLTSVFLSHLNQCSQGEDEADEQDPVAASIGDLCRQKFD